MPEISNKKRIYRVDNAHKERYLDKNLKRCKFAKEISECVFTFSDLAEADLTEAHFLDCSFSFSDLREVNGSGTAFMGCVFVGCNLKDANFNKSYFQECTFENCIGFGTQFIESAFMDCDISGAYPRSNWTECILIEGVRFGDMVLAEARNFPIKERRQ